MKRLAKRLAVKNCTVPDTRDYSETRIVCFSFCMVRWHAKDYRLRYVDIGIIVRCAACCTVVERARPTHRSRQLSKFQA